MPYKDPNIRAAYQKANLLKRRAVAKAFMAEVQSRTSCAKCGARPVEFHSEAHLTDPAARVGNLVGRGVSVERIKAEIARCEALCRRCHMEEDGRLARFRDNEAAVAARANTAPVGRLCSSCGGLAKPFRKGLCGRCYDHNRRTRKGGEW